MSEFTAQTTFKEKIDNSQLWLMHVNRTNLASGDRQGVYDAYVRQQLRLLPLNMQRWVQDQSDSYISKEEEFTFINRSGIRIGSKTDPMLYDDSKPVLRHQGPILFDDPNIKEIRDIGTEENPEVEIIQYDPNIPFKRLQGEIDWDDPNIMSPKRKINEVIDYEVFNLLIMAAAEKAGLSWNLKMHTYDDGDVQKKSKKKQSQHPLKKTSSGQIYADIPVGFDTKIISSTNDPDYNVIDWHGTRIIQGPGYGPLFFDMINARTNAENGTIIGIGGAPGIGKTYFGERLGEIINRVQPGRKFNPYLQIPFTQEHMLWLLSEDTPLELGDVIVLDEAHFAGGARNWFKEDQKEFVDMIASARNMGFIIILVVLHMSMLDKILRQFTMAFYIHLEKAGEATAYETFTPRFQPEMIKVTIGTVILKLPGINDCEHPRCLHCKHLNPETNETIKCFNLRASYERRKKIFQNSKVEASMERRKQKAKLSITDEDQLVKLHEFHSELTLTSHGNIENTVIQNIIHRELDLAVGKTKSRELAKRYMLKYPNETYITPT